MTSPILIPTTPGRAHYSQTTTLDGRAYVLEFDWIQRWQRWTLSVSTSAGVSLLRGAPLLCGVDLLAPHRWDLRLPPGSLGIFNAQNQGGDPDLTALGIDQSFTLVYIPAAAVEASSAAVSTEGGFGGGGGDTPLPTDG